jgi:hypothetical protein
VGVYAHIVLYRNMITGEKHLETGEATVAHSEFVGRGSMEVPRVTWWKHRGLRKLYPMMPILFLGSTINGYDGSLLNGLQTMTPWQECEY